MKKYALLASAASLLVASSALAADLPSRKVAPVAPVAPAFTWTGFYAGVNAGVDWSNRNVTPSWIFDPQYSFAQAIYDQLLPAPYGNSRTGFIGGIQVGYNYQISQFVIGAEADFMGASVGQRSTAIKDSTVSGLAGISTSSSTNINQNWLGTVRARAGFAADRALFYVTGGLAYGNANTSTTMGFGLVNTPIAWSGSKDTTKAGYTFGAGAEYAFTNNWIIRAEYLYYNLGDVSVLGTNNTYPNANLIQAKAKTTIDGNIVRAAISYKF